MQRVFVNTIRRRVPPAQITRHWTIRKASTNPSQPPPRDPRAGFERILSRTPKFLRPTLSALHNAPFSHITAFLILHEITAIVPLFGLAGAFHYYQWLPPYFAEGAWVAAGVQKFGKYFKRKGWISEADEVETEREVRQGRSAAEIEERGVSKGWNKGQDAGSSASTGVGKRWNQGEKGVRLVIEVATAYAIVKALLPLRIVLSVWGAPWFARWTVLPVGAAIKKVFAAKRS